MTFKDFRDNFQNIQALSFLPTMAIDTKRKVRKLSKWIKTTADENNELLKEYSAEEVGKQAIEETCPVTFSEDELLLLDVSVAVINSFEELGLLE